MNQTLSFWNSYKFAISAHGTVSDATTEPISKNSFENVTRDCVLAYFSSFMLGFLNVVQIRGKASISLY